jgi:hypothetical protein
VHCALRYSPFIQLQADIFTISTISCLSRDWNRIGKLLFYTVTPPLLIVVLGLPVRLASIVYVSHHKIKSAEFKHLKAKFYNAVRRQRIVFGVKNFKNKIEDFC